MESKTENIGDPRHCLFYPPRLSFIKDRKYTPVSLPHLPEAGRYTYVKELHV